MNHAQVLSSKGRFSVEFDRGCNPMTVNITELDSFGDITRQYYYFDGASITNSQTFTYQDPGVYQIIQIVGQDGVDKRDTLFVEALESRKPEVEIQKCNGQQISVTSIDNYYDSLRVYFTATDSVTLQQNETAEYTFGSSNVTTISLKGFFNHADEICSSYTEDIVPIPTLDAPEILDASIKETCKDVFTLYLELSSIDTLTNYRVNIIQTATSTIFDGYLDQTTQIFYDIPFEKASFCLNVEAYDPCNDTSESSSDFCSESTDLSLSPFEELYSTYDSSGIYINLDDVNVGTFKIYRRIQGGTFEERPDQTGSFTDRIGSNGRQYFYKIDYTDSCNQILYSAETNPPLVDAKGIETNEYNVSFIPPTNSFTEAPQNAYQSGNSFSQTSEVIATEEFTIRLNAQDGSPRQFITATSTYSNGVTLRSNAVTVRHELVIYVPNAFTPNGDGLNDTLELFGLPTEIATTNIYTRWGQLIYTSDQPSPGWDGTINGSLANEGTYLYEIIFETADGDIRSQKGTFALIKK
ncbi:gliding motility-associated C-terminal domain-containing protein [Ekhidna lutea]|nr:gliding motility-associated C-terminal domain-containing protein [Ekhidna lutea]